ncbi:TPA: restriction endonuclease [Aeromonas veronii]|uniref:restriction endonuclease n=1 Tax=Aeromonas sp. 603079 TaxID=2712045 RepID=UPI003BA00318
MTNENTEYEKLAQEIYQAISDAEGVKNINVQHNVKLLGKSGCNHQIDVYWEFEMMGIKHCVAIECKNYSSEVSVGKVRDFFGVLHDVGNTKGIFVTKVGYQSGAEKFANHYGIVLKELRFPTEKDWEGRVKNIVLTINVLFIDIKERSFDVDIDWLLANSNFKEGDQISFGCMADELKIVDSSGKVISTLHELENSLPRDKPVINQEAHPQFSDGFLVDPSSGQRFKINGIRYLYDVVSETQTSISEGNAIAKAILKDVNSGAIKFFDKSGNVRDVRDA